MVWKMSLRGGAARFRANKRVPDNEVARAPPWSPDELLSFIHTNATEPSVADEVLIYDESQVIGGV